MNDFIVPQELNIQDRIGKFTFSQLGFLAFGGLVLAVLLINKSMPMLVALLIGVPIFLLCVYLAFFKKFDMPIYEYLIVLIIYKSLPQERIFSVSEFKNEYEYLDDEEDIKEDELLIV